MTPTKEIEQLRQKVEEADALAQMKSNFLATMSHEIRTPMQTIYGLLELISESNDIAHTHSMAEVAQNAASGLLEILDDILDYAKMDADKMELDIFEVPLRLLVRGTLEALSVKVHGLKVDLIDDIDKSVPFVITGDPKRLRQIIMNLCGNAIKFTRQGSVTVRVNTNTAHINPQNGQIGLRFEVIDTGIGMSQEVSSRLFQSFSQADNTTQRKYGGTGLGLSIAKKLTELMDGKIGVESEEGKGSTFWFEIPAREVDVNETTIELPDLDGISVLSVEDHPQGAKEIVNSLQSMGAKVESCPTYQDGLKVIKRRPFDVAIIDQGLPDGKGLDLIKEITQIRPETGMIMYTVRDDPGLRHSLNALGVTYLTKPASRAGLGEAVKDRASKTDTLTIEGPKRLLIAEDTQSVRYTLEQQLKTLNIEADFVENGAQAKDALKSGKYGILCTDLHMPEMDGYALIKDIREKEKISGNHLPVIVMTADVQMGQRQAYMGYGFDECLLKPVSLGHLKGLLTRWGLLGHTPLKDNNAQEENIGGNKYPYQSEYIDFAALEQQMGTIDESTPQMLGMFIDMTRPIITNIQSAAKNKSLHDLTEHAHSLKGAARSAGCNVLGDLAAQLQDKSESNDFDQDLIDDVIKAFENTANDIAGF